MISMCKRENPIDAKQPEWYYFPWKVLKRVQRGPKTEQKLIDEGYLTASSKTGEKTSLQHFTTTARQEIIFEEMKKIVRGYLDLWYK